MRKEVKIYHVNSNAPIIHLEKLSNDLAEGFEIEEQIDFPEAVMLILMRELTQDK